MDMRDIGRQAKQKSTEAFQDLLQSRGILLLKLCREADAPRWKISTEAFSNALATSAAGRFSAACPDFPHLEAYLTTLHLKDLALALACAQGLAEAWESFVASYQSYLRACAAAMLQRGLDAPESRELADSLFAELYGVNEKSQGRRSLLLYFHGRSSLKTWLRAVLAQRHVDGIRAGRRYDPLDEGEGARRLEVSRREGPPQSAVDPHRQQYLEVFSVALQSALRLLEDRDSQRLRLYYAEGKNLAQIAETFGEHESTASRQVERARRDLRNSVEKLLRDGTGNPNGLKVGGGMSSAQIALCIAYAAEDAPIDLEKMFAPGSLQKSSGEEQKS